MPSLLAEQIAAAPAVRQGALWQGPCGKGPLGGISQSMISDWLGCRERFRIKYVIGLQPSPRFHRALEYGNMWHICEEALATHKRATVAATWELPLTNYCTELLSKHPMDREEVEKWYNVCCTQFPEYVKYWERHPDVQDRRPLMQEQVFDVPHELPSGRVVRLRGKFDSVDLVPSLGGIWIQENKSKSKIDQQGLQRQLRFDLQTMTYVVALQTMMSAEPTENESRRPCLRAANGAAITDAPIKGVRYNVVRRDCPIKQHGQKVVKEKVYKTKPNVPAKITPAETAEHWMGRLRDEYFAAEPEEWFWRWNAEIGKEDVDNFKKRCLDPVLENICWHYDEVTGAESDHLPPPSNWVMPFGVYNPVTDAGATDYDSYIENGSEAGLRQVEALFPELK
jgi:hypothetical protein